MNGVVGMADLIAETTLDDEQRLYVDTIKTSAEALLVIINDVLDYSKIEAERLVLHPEPFDLERCIHDVATLLLPAARDKGLTMAIDYDPRLPTGFTGDPGRLRQVLTNLVGNAVKFTHSGHVLVSATGRPGAQDGTADLHITIEDTGIGVPPDKSDHIFGEFNQVDDDRNRRYEGTGLGLAISQRLIRLMGGDIWLRSDPGQGSCFGFDLTLPLAGDWPAPADATGAGPVLIVETRAVHRRVLAGQLARMGADVVTAETADAVRAAPPPALIILGEAPPDMVAALSDHGGQVVLATDQRAPDLSGFADPARLRVLTLPARVEAMRALLDIAPPEVAAAPPNREQPATRTVDRRAMRVLAAEDNRTNRLVFSGMVKDLDIDLRFANDGAEAVAAHADFAPDLIFMDISMPAMDGREATRRIRAAEEGSGRRTPIVALTAHALTGDGDAILKAGLDFYLTKPLQKQAIRARILAACPEDCRTPDPAGDQMSG